LCLAVIYRKRGANSWVEPVVDHWLSVPPPPVPSASTTIPEATLAP
jgi:hypothetical protein